MQASRFSQSHDAEGNVLIWDDDVTTTAAIFQSVSASSARTVRASRSAGDSLPRMLASADLVFFSLNNDEQKFAQLLHLASGATGLEIVYYLAQPGYAGGCAAIARMLALEIWDIDRVADPEVQKRIVPMLVRRARARAMVAETSRELERLRCSAMTEGVGLLDLPLPEAETAFRAVYVNLLIERYRGLRQAAKKAGVSHTTLLNILRKLNIGRPPAARGGTDASCEELADSGDVGRRA